MGSNRRAFLKFAGLAPAAAAAGVVAPAAARAAAAGPLRKSSFLACVGEEFRFEAGPFAQRAANLVAVAPLGSGPGATESEDAFRLEFAPAVPGSIPQESYTVTHPGLGRFALFVSPNDAEGRVVEAVFNRI